MPSPPLVSRRSALLTAAKALGCFCIPLRARAADPRIVAVTDGAGAAGAELGIAEARHAWELLRRAVELERIDLDTDAGLRRTDPAALGSCVVFSVADPDERARWTNALREAGVVHIDAGTRVPDEAPCHPLGFWVGAPANEAERVLWHSSLERYGARQLNDRFETRFGAPMRSDDWAAWFAVKVASEAMLRAGAEPAALAGYLSGTRTAFDGHKGRPLRFGADHRLIQPLYSVRRSADGSELAEEVAPDADTAAPCAAGGSTP